MLEWRKHQMKQEPLHVSFLYFGIGKVDVVFSDQVLGKPFLVQSQLVTCGKTKHIKRKVQKPTK